jgi:tetratricopeptide (TPR) repeat protein
MAIPRQDNAAHAADRWLDRAIRVTAVLLLLAVASLALYWIGGRYAHATVSVVDRDTQIVEGQIRDNPGDAALRVAAANLYLEKGRYDDAIAQAEQALLASDGNLGALVALGQAYVRKGRLDQAATYFQRAIETNRGNPMARASLQLAHVHRSLGLVYLELGRAEDAAMQFRETLAIHRGDADAHHLLGEALVGMGQIDEGIESYRRALRFVPDFPDVYRRLQSAYEKQGDPVRAGFAAGMVRYGKGDYERAAEMLARAAQAVPDMVEIQVGLAMAYERLGRNADALESYRRALAIDGSSVVAKQGIGRLEGRQR